MDAELKTKWVKALRSGEYKQAEEVLKASDGALCCLGVLCVVSGAEWKEFNGQVDDEWLSYDHVPVVGDELLSNGEDQELHPGLSPPHRPFPRGSQPTDGTE